MARECVGCPLEHVEVDTLCETNCDENKRMADRKREVECIS